MGLHNLWERAKALTPSVLCVLQDYSDALGWLSFRAEGDVEFKSLLYIPKTAPFDFYEKYYEKKGGSLKLYVRRVFISDEVAELLPR